jgi:phage shock protein PspC (stress-responsive transcriptional regulator)
MPLMCGVLSGAAAFFKINPLWVRLIFIIIALASFGTALLVYIVLWIAVPPARNAADKLQMNGRPVTVESIRELNENDASRPLGSGSGRRVLLVLAGIVSLFMAAGAAVATVGAAIMVMTHRYVDVFGNMPGSSYFITAFLSVLISGVLFTALMTLTTYAAFAGRMTKRVLISGAVIVGLGLVTFGVAVASAQYGAFVRNQEVRQNTHETAITLPADAKAAKAISVDAPGVEVEYITVSTDPNATMRSVMRDPSDSKLVIAEMDGTTLKVRAKEPQNSTCQNEWCGWDVQTKVTIYGPVLETATVANNTGLSYVTLNQSVLAVTAERGSHIDLSGSVESVRAILREDASMNAADAALSDVNGTLDISAQLSLATVQTLTISGQKACASSRREARVSVERVGDSNIMINGESHPATSMDSGCLELKIEGEER